MQQSKHCYKESAFSNQPHSLELQEKVINNIIDELSSHSVDFNCELKRKNTLLISHKPNIFRHFKSRRYPNLMGVYSELIFERDYRRNLVVHYKISIMKQPMILLFLFFALSFIVTTFAFKYNDFLGGFASIVSCLFFWLAFFFYPMPIVDIKKLIKISIEKAVEKA